MNATRIKIYLNSTFAFISAFVITTIIHEGGHFLSYTLFGAHPGMYHNFVRISDTELELSVRIISALAGPLISLVQGLLFWAILSVRKNNRPVDLLFLWLSLLGLVNFFGYLMLTPLSGVGDTGKVAQMLALPSVYRFAISLLGIAILILLVLRIGIHFAGFLLQTTGETLKRKSINSILLFPLLTGSLVNSLLALPAPVFLSIIYPATSSFVIMSAYGRILKSGDKTGNESVIQQRISVALAGLTIILIFINRVLAHGAGRLF